MVEIGINSNNECGITPAQKFEMIRKSGFNTVMISAKDGDLETNIVQAKMAGLSVPVVHLSSHYSDDLWVRGETNERYVANILNEIEICGKYNIPFAVMHASVGNPSKMIITLNDHGLFCMQKILNHAEKHNVKIALENVDNTNIKRVETLLDAFDSKWLGFCFDVGHYYLFKTTTDLMKKYSDRLFVLHLHDNLMDYEYGFDTTRDLHLLPFDGVIDYDKVCRKIAIYGLSAIPIIEVHKIAVGEPRLYKEMSDFEFLTEAYKRVQRLNENINKYRKV